MNDQTIKNFLQRCKKERGSTLPAIFLYFVTKSLGLNFLESVIHNDRCVLPGTFTTVKHFTKFLFEMKTSIEKVLGSDYKVEVYNSLDILDEWSYDKHVFQLREGDELIKPDHIEQSIVMKLTSRRCCSTTVKIYSLWESIYEGLAKDHGNILVSYNLFTVKPFPDVPVNIHFCSSFYQYCFTVICRIIYIEKLSCKNLSVLFVDDLRKWFRKKEVRDCINWCRYFSYTFPDLHMNDQTSSSLYTFNAVDFPKQKNWEKTLHHFYNLCNIIFKEIRDNLSEPVIHLFHDKRLGNGIAIAVKLCNEIHPSESANYCCIMKEAFKKLFEDDFTNRFFLCFFGRRMKERKFIWGIPKPFSK